jgi:hypothetical protein
MAIKPTTRSDLCELPWVAIIALGAFSLLRPVLSIVGAYDDGPLRKPVGPLMLTALIALAVLRRRSRSGDAGPRPDGRTRR